MRPREGSDFHKVLKHIGDRAFQPRIFLAVTSLLGRDWAVDVCRGHPQTFAFAVQLPGSIWGHMVTSGEVPATERESLAFWISVGTASHQGQSEKPKWNLDVQVGLDIEVGPWQVAQFQHPSARAARQVAPCPGQIQLILPAVPATLPSPPSSYRPAGPQTLG